MAEIDRPLLPTRFFRYRDVSSIKLAKQELDTISKNYLWFSRYRDLNDPMEGKYGTSPWLMRQTGFAALANEILMHKNFFGVCCFSDIGDSELMWVNYAKNYSGICVEYSTRQLHAGLGEGVHIVRLAYDGKPPRIGKAYLGHPKEAARTILSHKKSSWIYEREWRLLADSHLLNVPGPLKIEAGSAIKSVYIGPRMSNNIKQYIESELAKMKIPVRPVAVSGYEHRW
jgi:hypothetical protein